MQSPHRFEPWCVLCESMNGRKLAVCRLRGTVQFVTRNVRVHRLDVWRALLAYYAVRPSTQVLPGEWTRGSQGTLPISLPPQHTRPLFHQYHYVGTRFVRIVCCAALIGAEPAIDFAGDCDTYLPVHSSLSLAQLGPTVTKRQTARPLECWVLHGLHLLHTAICRRFVDLLTNPFTHTSRLEV